MRRQDLRIRNIHHYIPGAIREHCRHYEGELALRIPQEPRKKRAIAGIVAALILFVMLFTIGSSYFLYQAVLGHIYDTANVSAQQQAQAKESEQLAITTFLNGGLSATATNVGGVPSVIVGMYLQDPTATPSLVCVSPQTGAGPAFCPNYSTVSIPIDVGGRSTINTGETVGCSAQPSACTIALITQLGNVFTQKYPMPATSTGLLQTSTSITTQLSSTSITFGNSVTDSATLAGVTSSAGGNVKYYFFDNLGHTDNTCSGAGVQVSSVTVTNGVVPNSGSRSFPDPTYVGSYSWDAVYSGDSNNNAAISVCEPMSVTKFSPTLTTNPANGGVITIGATETDTASISGSFSAPPTGTITFQVFTPSCSGAPQPYFPGGTTSDIKTIVGGSAVSDSITPPAIGTYYWTASYSGDSNYNAVVGQCELLVVQTTNNPSKINPTITTTLSSSSIVAGNSVTDSATFQNTVPAPSGMIAFEAFSTPTCSGSPVYYSSPVVVNGPGPWGPSSPGFFPTVVGSPSYRWEVIYTGDNNYNPAITSCTAEPLTVTKATPTITTTLSSSNVVGGQSVSDTATLVGSSGSNAGGTVTFYYSSSSPSNNNPCTLTGTTTVGSFPVVGGSAVSSSVKFDLVGTYYWYAVYSSGDANNNAGAVSACETLSVVIVSASGVSQGIGSVQMDFNSFKWYSSGNCDPGTAVTIGQNPAKSCTLKGGLAGSSGSSFVKLAPLAYTVSQTGMTNAGTNLWFSMNITNVDPQKRTLVIDQFTQVWFSWFCPEVIGSNGPCSPGPHGQAATTNYGLVNMTKPYPTNPSTTVTPSVTIRYGQTATLFFGLQAGAGTPTLLYPGIPLCGFGGSVGFPSQITPVFIFFHGTLNGNPYGQDFPLASVLWTNIGSSC